MIEINVREARQRFSELLDRVEQGEEVVVTRHGNAIAKLVPAEPQRKRPPPLDTFRKTIGATGTPSATLIREDRDAR
jgi:prevent-host-death family protein